MTWLEKDIRDLNEIVKEFCAVQDCDCCVFNRGRCGDCLNDIARSLNRTSDMIKKCKKEMSCYV